MVAATPSAGPAKPRARGAREGPGAPVPQPGPEMAPRRLEALAAASRGPALELQFFCRSQRPHRAAPASRVAQSSAIAMFGPECETHSQEIPESLLDVAGRDI